MSTNYRETSDMIIPYQGDPLAGELIVGNDRLILRDLAAQVAHLAQQPCEKEKANLWRLHNQLVPVRPLILCDPELGWNEIIPEGHLRCESVASRRLEWLFRREIFWGSQLKDDRVVNDYLSIPLIFREIDWGVHETRRGGADGGSYAWDAPLRNEEDIEKIHPPQIMIDFETSHRQMLALNDLLGDLMPVRQKTNWWWTLGLSDLLAKFRGLEQIMYDMIDAPQLIHAIMKKLRDGTLRMLDELERLDLLATNHQGDYVGSGGYGWTDELPGPGFSGRVRTQDLWGFAESQETVSISPRMFAEFILPYQWPILERFGLNCYGCCEPLDKRWKYIADIPNLRRVSVSPWANRSKMAEYLEDHFVYSLKPSPSDFSASVFDEQAVRESLRRDLSVTRGCRLEIILKDLTTLRGEPQRIVRWVQIAREEIARLY